MAINLIAYFKNEGIPATGLTPTVSVWTLDGNQIVSSASMIEVAGGFYTYPFTSYNEQYDYVIRCDGGATLEDGDRYVSSSNELDVNVSGGGMGLTGDIIWDLKKISDNMSTDKSLKKEIDNLKKELKKIKLPKQDNSLFSDLKKDIQKLTDSNYKKIEDKNKIVLDEFKALRLDLSKSLIELSSSKGNEISNLSKNMLELSNSLKLISEDLLNKGSEINSIVNMTSKLSEISTKNSSLLNKSMFELNKSHSTMIENLRNKVEEDIQSIIKLISKNNINIMSKFEKELKATNKDIKKINKTVIDNNKEVVSKFSNNYKLNIDNSKLISQLDNQIKNLSTRLSEDTGKISSSNTLNKERVSKLIKDLELSRDEIKQTIINSNKDSFDILNKGVNDLKDSHRTKEESDVITFERFNEINKLREDLLVLQRNLQIQISSENKSEEVISQLKNEITNLEVKMTDKMETIVKKIGKGSRDADLVNQMREFEDKEDQG